jgi:membrane protease subunit HflC
MRAFGPILAVLVALVLVGSSMLFTVDQRQNAIVFQFGEVKEVITAPGLKFKWPMIQNVRLFDMRILAYDDPEPLRFLTQGNRPVLVDSFIR